jgi:hypothetical protein
MLLPSWLLVNRRENSAANSGIIQALRRASSCSASLIFNSAIFLKQIASSNKGWPFMKIWMIAATAPRC